MTKKWRLKTRELELNGPIAMGILNATPDSFSDGGNFQTQNRDDFEIDLEAFVARAKQLVDEGAAILDVGGESTRPNAAPVSGEEERRRVLPAIRALTRTVDVPISIDSYRPSTVDAALDAGAEIANDVFAGRFIESQNRVACSSERDFPEEMAEVVRRRDAAVVLMSASGDSQTGWTSTVDRSNAIVGEVFSFLAKRRDRFVELGVPIDKIAFDPGVGFGKTFEENWRLLRDAREFGKLGGIVLFGCSRKRFLVEALRRANATTQPTLENRDFATAATSVALARRGVDVLRVHNVAQTTSALYLARLVGDLEE